MRHEIASVIFGLIIYDWCKIFGIAIMKVFYKACKKAEQEISK